MHVNVELIVENECDMIGSSICELVENIRSMSDNNYGRNENNYEIDENNYDRSFGL